MADLFFKRGLAANLPDGTTTFAQDGVFYLTKDTERLYVGIKKNDADTNATLVELNKSIRTISNLNNLPTTGVAIGDFYYIEPNGGGTNVQKGNILAVCTGFNADNTPKWTQVNPDTNTTLKASTGAVSVTAGTGESAVVTTTVQDTNSTSATGNFTIKGENIDVSVDGTVITLKAVKGALYSLSNNSTTISLTEDSDGTSTTKGSVKLSGGTYVDVTSSAAGEIKVDLKKSPMDTASFVKKNGLGNLTEGVAIQTAHGDGTNEYSVFNPVIKLDNGDADETTVSLGGQDWTFDLPVYTKTATEDVIASKIAENLKTFDAMNYMGVLSQTNLNTIITTSDKARKGDVYKASEGWNLTTDQKAKLGDGSKSVTAVKPGDLIIFQGAESTTNGFLTLNSIKFDVIPSGDDQVIEFINNATTGVSQVFERNAQNGAGYQAVAGNKMSITYSQETANNGKYIKATINHATQTVTDPATPVTGQTIKNTGLSIQEDSKKSIDVVSDVTYDDYGHITGIETTRHTIYDTHNRIAEVKNTVAASGTTGASVTTQVKMADGDVQSGSFTVNGADNVKVAVVSNKMQISLEWGEF